MNINAAAMVNDPSLAVAAAPPRCLTQLGMETDARRPAGQPANSPCPDSEDLCPKISEEEFNQIKR